MLASGAVLAALVVGCTSHSPDSAGSQPLATPQAPIIQRAAEGKYIEGSYIVVMKDSVGDVDNEVDDIDRRHGTRASFRFMHAIKGFAGKFSPAMVEALRSDPRVEYIEQDQEVHIVGTQVNPPSWGLDRIDQRSLPLNNSYTYNQTGIGVDAYIIDTGIRTTHADFGGRAVPGYDAITSGGTAADGNGHGTHVAGTVGGTSYGVAKNVRLVAVRVLDNAGSGTTAGVIAGIDWVTANRSLTRPSVANMSLGGGPSPTLDDAVRRSIVSGVTYCIAAGNSSADASGYSPARVNEAITVGATDITDGFASFSNFGSVVKIQAPGVNITSAWNTTDTATNTISGTSMATPHVAGAAALYLEANPTATPAAVLSGLTSNATNNVITGLPSGTVNKLLYSILVSTPPPPPPAAPSLSAPVNGATGVAVPATLSWNASTGAASYTAQVSTSSAFTTFAYNTSGITSTSTSVSGLAANTLYYWRANATNAGGTSAWSSTWTFTTSNVVPPPVPAAPTLVSPVNGATGVAIPAALSWNASSGADSYSVQVSTSSAFTTLAYSASGITSTSTSAPGLALNTRYYWRVKATNTAGTSAWSATGNFRTVKK